MSGNTIKAKRAKLHKDIQTLVGDSVKVYFEPVENVKMEYPCVIYRRTRRLHKWALNVKYLDNTEYDIIYVTEDPDDDVVTELLKLNMSSYDRRYVTNSMYHDVIQVFI